jgi:hypothetical protein
MRDFYFGVIILGLFILACFFTTKKENESNQTINDTIIPCVVGCNSDVYLNKEIKYTIKNVKNIKIDTLHQHQHINIDTNETYTLYEYTIIFEID